MTLQDERDQYAAEDMGPLDEHEQALLSAFVRCGPSGNITAKGIPFVVVAGVAMTGLFGTTGTVVSVPADAAEIRYAGGWTTTQPVITAEVPPWLHRPASDTRDVPATAALTNDRPDLSGRDITVLRELSGLTYKQISKIFGVSERAVHLWAGGTTTPAPRHLERLGTVLEAVHALDGPDASSRRAQLLREGQGQPGIYNRWLRELAADRPAVGDVDTLHEPARHA